ncbi:MAG: hypothetical protein WC549_06580 [Actinomycetota bacterium]
MTLEDEFNNDMLDIYEKAKVYKYYATRYLQMVRRRGGLEAAKILINKKITPTGFNELVKLGRTDLSVEALVASDKYKELKYFTDEDRRKASDRLQEILKK